MPEIPGQRWSCHSCGRCCRELVGHLTSEERARIDAYGWRERLGTAPYIHAGGSWSLNKHSDGACVFLDEENRCRIHAEQGESSKPLACRIFPFSVRAVGKGWQASFRFDCPSAARSQGASLESHRPWLEALVRELDHADPGDNDLPDLRRGLQATRHEISEIVERFVVWLRFSELPLRRRLIGAARITGLLAAASFDKVRGARFSELLDLVFAALPGESGQTPEPPTPRQRGMLRQLAFAHAEHVSLAELRAGWFANIAKRWQQMRMARRFRLGRGALPPLAGVNVDILPARDKDIPQFHAIEEVEPAKDDADAVDDLLLRYLVGRLQGNAVFGGGYYGWSMFNGLGALWLSAAVAGWLARYRAVQEARNTLIFDDASFGIGIVDRGATRLPALGTLAERTRLAYLLGDDGIARLVDENALVGREHSAPSETMA